MQITKVGKASTYRFEGWNEFVDYASNRPVLNPSFVNAHTDYTKGGYDSWDKAEWRGSKTFQEALDLAENGWQEGLAKVKALSSVLMNKVTALVELPELVYDVTGSDFDMGLIMAGAPEHWYTIENKITEGIGTRILKLVFNNCVSAGIDTEVMIARGAGAAALIEALEYAGFRCEVVLCSGNHYDRESRYGQKEFSGYELDSYVPIKAADQQLDLDRLTFALAHPSTFRRFQFAVWESDKDFCAHASIGYGQPANIPKEEQGDIYFNQAYLGEPQWKNVEQTVDWILQRLKEQGVTISE